MVGDEVERVEVQPLGLELGTLGHLPAHGDEDVLHQVHQGGDRMHRADGLGLDRQRHVDPLLDQDAGQLGRLDLGLARLQRLVDRAAGLADAGAGLLAGLRRQGADLPVGQGDRRPVAGVGQPGLLELGHRGRRRKRRQRLGHHGLDVLGVQRRDLNGVVAGVRAGHGSPRG